MYPSSRRKRAMLGMLASICLVLAGAMMISWPNAAARGSDRIGLYAASTGLAGGVVSWLVSRKD